MMDHLTRAQIEELQAKAPAPEEMLAAVEHLENCPACHAIYREVFRERRGGAPVVFSLSEADWFREDHLEYEDLAGLIGGKLDEEYRRILGIHLDGCARCRQAVAEMEEVVMAGEPPAAVPQVWQRWLAWPDWLRIPRFAYTAAAAIAVVLILAGLLYVAKSIVWREIGGTVVDAPSPQPSPESSLLALDKGEGKVEADALSAIPGLDRLPPMTRQAVNEVLGGAEIEKPRILAEVAGAGGRTRGRTDAEPAFHPISPVGRVVAEQTPVFRWEPLAGATGYRIDVVNLDRRESVSSGTLPATATSWTPAQPLRRGDLHGWTVTAIVDGREVTSPAPAEPEAKFAILTREQAEELRQLKEVSAPHLALGVFYARAGMPAEAEREFQMLAREYPSSPLAKKLLDRARSRRVSTQAPLAKGGISQD